MADVLLFFNWLNKAKKIRYSSYFEWKQRVIFIFSGLLVFLGSLLFFSSKWAMNYFGDLKIDQIIYTLSQPLTGTDPGQIKEFITSPLLAAGISVFSIMSLFYFLSTFSIVKIEKSKILQNKRVFSALVVGISFLMLFLGTILGVREIGYADIRSYFFETTTIYESHYVDPSMEDIAFPEEKRNLIYIFMESLESSYFSEELGGIQAHNLLPNLGELSLNEGINFSNRGELGGMLTIPSASQTVSAMVAQTSGIPLRIPTGLDANDYGQNGAPYLPGAFSIGEVLEKEGYQQTLLLGSDAAFSGRDNYFTQHGNYNIIDYNSAKENGWIPEDYRVWWGYEDEKLYEYARNIVSEMSQHDAPFNFTMLTADTHFEDGLMTENTPQIFDDQYSNVIHYADGMVREFIEWIKIQPFFENTTIIVCGDHLTMDSDFFVDVSEDYERSVFNLILNSGKNDFNNKNRLFSAVDMYPTTLAALGAEIPNDRLGLGTNLFSNSKTIIEELGYDELYTELSKRSKYYENNIIQGTDLGVVYQ
ncbi:LTA synthase family protein [Enterococcus sp. AZ109]|uniref:LTA synthase family protein n=1 Tax=Enterococcus sp. AZ109 TaxID=2774634 RepID=UPI003F68631F